MLKRKTDPSPAMMSALRAIESIVPPDSQRPEEDSRYLLLTQLYSLANETLARARMAEFNANQVKLCAMAEVAEIKVRLEILAEELGIIRENSEEL